MDKFAISGGKPLIGSVKVEGSKNAALPIIFASLLINKGETVIKNVPPLRDIYTAIKMMEYLGARITYDEKSMVMTVNAESILQDTAPYELMKQMRASFLVLGPILVRTGSAQISLPGGCVLGSRPVDFHIKAFKTMGASIKEKSGYVIASAKKLNGGLIYFDRPSHTGTENILYAAVMAKEKSIIINAACDPEVVDVANFLNKAGAKIKGAGTPYIEVEPVKKLNNIEYTVSGDRLVAGTFLIGAAMTEGNIKVSGTNPDDLTMVLCKLREMGCTIASTRKSISLKGPQKLNPTSITTFPYPGFPTDLQAAIMSAATIADGVSRIRETVFNDRFSHTMELRRLGADITVANDEAIISGAKNLSGAQVMSSDIRAGAGLVLACLAARGKSEVLRVYHIDRAYHEFEDKLSLLGADIKRVKA